MKFDKLKRVTIYESYLDTANSIPITLDSLGVEDEAVKERNRRDFLSGVVEYSLTGVIPEYISSNKFLALLFRQVSVNANYARNRRISGGERSDEGQAEVTERSDEGQAEVTERSDEGQAEVTERSDECQAEQYKEEYKEEDKPKEEHSFTTFFASENVPDLSKVKVKRGKSLVEFEQDLAVSYSGQIIFGKSLETGIQFISEMQTRISDFPFFVKNWKMLNRQSKIDALIQLARIVVLAKERGLFWDSAIKLLDECQSDEFMMWEKFSSVRFIKGILDNNKLL